MIEETKPTITDCLEAVRKINEGIPNTEELLMHKARWLYMLNRLSFWNDLPVLLDIIKYEIEVKKLSKANVRGQFICPCGKATDRKNACFTNGIVYCAECIKGK